MTALDMDRPTWAQVNALLDELSRLRAELALAEALLAERNPDNGERAAA